jgi:hypothetical protein
MHLNTLSHLLLVTLTVAFMAGGLGTTPVDAKGNRDWTDMVSRENVFVQACSGFNITSSYTTVRKYHVVEDYTGQTVFERRDVSFDGAVVNAVTGGGFGFDGGFVRTSDYDQNTTSISNLILRFDPPGQGEVTVSVARQEGDLVDNLPAVLRAFAPFVNRNSLCDLLSDPASAAEPFTSQPTLLDPCLSLQRGRPC